MWGGPWHAVLVGHNHGVTPSRTFFWCTFALALTLGVNAQEPELPVPAPAPASRSAVSSTLRLYIARHGETAYNAERRVQGQLDIPLNGRGLAQADALRVTLRGVHFDAIYTSPLSRGLTTAGIVADGRPVRVLKSLTERSQGGFEGLLADSAADFARRMTDPSDGLDGGETTHQLGERARLALATIRRAHPAGSVLVVGHFLTNQMLLRELLRLPTKRAMEITQANDELYMVELTRSIPPRAWKLIGPTHLGEL
jgi:broad specificity phosphatase PhoE